MHDHHLHFFPLWLFSPNHFELTICFATSLWIHYLIPEMTINSRFFSQFHFKFTIVFARSLYIHYRFREFTLCFANSLWNRYLLREFTIHQKSFRGFGLNQLLFPRINSDFIIYFTNSIWICSFYSESFTYYDSFT